MSLSDEVALAALVVSLVALLVTFLQTSQAFLNTSEGYRNCRREVMGPWATRTSRKWHWSEFRFETRWAAPEIDLMTPAQFKERATPAGSRRRGPYHLNVEAPRHATDEIYYTVHAGIDAGSDLDSQVSWLPLLRELHQCYATYQSDHTRAAVPPPPPPLSNRIVRRFDANARPPFENAISAADSHGTERSTPQRTDVAITYREFTWDFVPPEVVRPLAMVRFGTLVVLAVRLGMHWQVLDPEAETMRAAGNSLSLNAVRIRGMGMLVQFSKDPGSKIDLDFIPHEAADKMMCGILPVCKNLVGGDDYPLIGEDKKLSLTHIESFLRHLRLSERISSVTTMLAACLERHALDHLGPDNFMQHLSLRFMLLIFQTQKLLRDLRVSENVFQTTPSLQSLLNRAADGGQEYASALNDGLILMCPFMPILDASCFRIQFPCWFGGAPYATSTFPEGRIILLSEISKRVDARQNKQSPEKVSYVHRVLKRLESEFPDFWYNDCISSNVDTRSREDSSMRGVDRNRKSLVVVCSEAFEETTRYFEQLKLHNKQGVLPQEQYKMLVAAHLSFGVQAASWVRDQRNKGTAEKMPRKGTSSIYLNRFGKWPVPEDRINAKPRITRDTTCLADLTWAFIARKEWFLDEVRHRLDQLRMPDDTHGLCILDVEDAWWMLMLRAVCWSMAITIDTPRGVAIPASFYDIRTPVWIT